jgi:2'-5' RNA ligase
MSKATDALAKWAGPHVYRAASPAGDRDLCGATRIADKGGMSGIVESALTVLVPDAEPLVKPFRDRYDPSAAAGVPAHITLLYPFKHPDEIDQTVVDDLRRSFHRRAPFRFSLVSIRRFPDAVLYLAPEPDEPFRDLTSAIWLRYPQTPPYGGKWPNVVPHLSVASVGNEQPLDLVSDDFARAAQGKLPIRATANGVVLMEKRSDRWLTRATFEFEG